MLHTSAHRVGCRQAAVKRGRNLEAAVACTDRVLSRDGDDVILDADAAAQINRVIKRETVHGSNDDRGN